MINDPNYVRSGKNFEILVKGQLGEEWSDWLEGMKIALTDDGNMKITGVIVDQSALMGILNKINSLNLQVLSVNHKNEN
jgi:hypothetical protein